MVGYFNSTHPNSDYLNEDSSPLLSKISILFMVLQTVFMVLFAVSRYFCKTAQGIDYWVLIPLGFVFCMGNCVISICMSLAYRITSFKHTNTSK